MHLGSPCPCGSTKPYDACCAPLHHGARLAATPEELMRSRYSAHAIGDLDHVFRTWHPRTRPHDLTADPRLRWIGLEVLEATDAEVELVARYETPDGPGEMRERSLFEQRAGRWLYVGPLD